MTKSSEKRVVTADEIAEMADAGMDITRFFTGFWPDDAAARAKCGCFRSAS